MKQCQTCGAQLSPTDTICNDCGTEVSANPLPAVTPPPSSASAPASAPPQQISPQPTSTIPSVSTAGNGGRLTLRRGGKLTTDTFEFEGIVVVGRFDADSGPVDIDLGKLPEGEYLSRRHAEIGCRDGGVWFVRDLGSQNGTFHKSASGSQFTRIVQEQLLADGDELSFGNARFEFKVN